MGPAPAYAKTYLIRDKRLLLNRTWPLSWEVCVNLGV